MKSEDLWHIFQSLNLTFFTGVPDSTFNEWMTFLDCEHGKNLTNIIAVNECEAVAIAMGYHLASENIGVVYMQNAGEGKTINPLTSLCDPKIYSIPIILMIGWRGEPGKKDEPQHWKMGEITLPLLELMDIPYKILPSNTVRAESVVQELVRIAISGNRPVAMIIKKETLDQDIIKPKMHTKFEMNREDAIKTVMESLSGEELIISTTGKTSRELFEYRIHKNEVPRDFYTVGGMGCASAIAFGVANYKKNRKIIVLDGDGSVLMQMGSLATIGHYKPENLFHIIFDNASHDSTGGQPTVSPSIDFDKIGQACGYTITRTVESKIDLVNALEEMKNWIGPAMLVIKISKGSRTDLGRPTTTPIQNKLVFMDLARN